MTGVPNQRALADWFSREERVRTDEFAYLMGFTVHGLSRMRARSGQDSVDLVMERFADDLKKSVREEDFIARLDGDEFAVIITSSNESIVAGVKERMSQRFDETVIHPAMTNPLRSQFEFIQFKWGQIGLDRLVETVRSHLAR